MPDSILNTTKKALNLDADYTEFDPEIIMYINGVFATLTQIGIGPELGFSIEDADAKWSTFLEGNNLYNGVKNYMYLKVRMLFDPPTTSYHITAMEKQIEELEVRLSITREETHWTNPNPIPIASEGDVVILDGGSA